MWGYFCTGFIDFMLKCPSLLDYTNLFSPNEYKKNDKIILNLLSIESKKVKMIGVYCNATYVNL